MCVALTAAALYQSKEDAFSQTAHDKGEGRNTHLRSREVAILRQHSDIGGDHFKSDLLITCLLTVVAGSSSLSPKSFSKLISFTSADQLPSRDKDVPALG